MAIHKKLDLPHDPVECSFITITASNLPIYGLAISGSPGVKAHPGRAAGPADH